MPELPEVETTRRGIAPHVLGQTLSGVVVREPRLRWPVPPDLGVRLTGQTLGAVERRGKYLLLRFAAGALMLHLGMSGRLRLLSEDVPHGAHDHLDLVFGKLRLRLHDPRRFASVLWAGAQPLLHPLLAHLGPEPLDPTFAGDYLHRRAQGRSLAIKPFLMDSSVVAGLGNIYANEALFRAGIHPLRAAGRTGLSRYRRLASAVQEVLAQAIEQGGTTLRDFLGSDGRPGYFEQQLEVYGRHGLPCVRCKCAIRRIRQGQRSTFYCPQCQR